MKSKETGGFYIKGFDGLRAISIIMVLLTHLGVYDPLLGTTFGMRLWLTLSGEMGVYVFFVISGFLITTLLLREKKEKGSVSYKRFIARRFLRLLPPLLFFYTVIIILMISGQLQSNYLSLGISAIYLYNFIPNKFYVTELGHTWSLAVEEQFYFLWPFAIKLFEKRQLLVTVFCTILFSVVAIFMLPTITFYYKNEWLLLGEKFKTHRWFFPAIAPVMTGAAMAIFNFNFYEIVKSRINHKGFLFLSAALILCAFYLPLSLRNFVMFFQAIGVALILVYIFHNCESRLTKVLEFYPLAFIGKISYGIYVWQGLFLRTGPGGALWIQQFPQNILLTLIVAMASYKLIEQKMQVYRKHMH